MQFAVLTYISGSSSVLFTLIATVLNGLCYASKYSTPNSQPADFAFVSLSAVSCVGLVALMLLLRKDILTGPRQWETWKIGVYCAIATYLLITAAIAAGATAWSDSQLMRKTKADSLGEESLFVARSVIWAMSIFKQGLFCGILLLSFAFTTEEQCRQWPHPESKDAEMTLNGNNRGSYPVLSSHRDSQPVRPMTSSGKITSFHSAASNTSSEISNSFSGLTLFQQDGDHCSTRPNTSSRRYSEPQTGARAISDDGTGMRNAQRSRQWINGSLDNLIMQSLPEASTSNTTPSEQASRPGTSREEDIHPLFRPSSPSPPPTPTFGTIVTASPVAGQTITAETLQKLRSSNQFSFSNLPSEFSALDQAKSPEGTEEQQVNESIESSVPRFILQANLSQQCGIRTSQMLMWDLFWMRLLESEDGS